MADIQPGLGADPRKSALDPDIEALVTALARAQAARDYAASTQQANRGYENRHLRPLLDQPTK